jgi:hypothetical protein
MHDFDSHGLKFEGFGCSHAHFKIRWPPRTAANGNANDQASHKDKGKGIGFPSDWFGFHATPFLIAKP